MWIASSLSVSAGLGILSESLIPPLASAGIEALLALGIRFFCKPKPVSHSEFEDGYEYVQLASGDSGDKSAVAVMPATQKPPTFLGESSRRLNPVVPVKGSGAHISDSQPLTLTPFDFLPA